MQMLSTIVEIKYTRYSSAAFPPSKVNSSFSQREKIHRRIFCLPIFKAISNRL